MNIITLNGLEDKEDTLQGKVLQKNNYRVKDKWSQKSFCFWQRHQLVANSFIKAF